MTYCLWKIVIFHYGFLGFYGNLGQKKSIMRWLAVIRRSLLNIALKLRRASLFLHLAVLVVSPALLLCGHGTVLHAKPKLLTPTKAKHSTTKTFLILFDMIKIRPNSTLNASGHYNYGLILNKCQYK